MYPPQGGPPPPGAPHAPPPPPPVQAEQPQTINPADASRKADDPPVVEKNGVDTNGTSKKRSRSGKNGESKAKKAKLAHAAPIAQAEKEKEDEIVTEEQTVHDEGDSDNTV